MRKTIPVGPLKKFLYDALEESENRIALNRRVNGFIMALILLSVLLLILETVDSFESAYAPLFLGLEIFTVSVFALEYAARAWIADLKPDFQRYRYPRLRYLVSAAAIIDLLAILPFFLPLLMNDLRLLRTLRLFRLLRVMKLGRYSDAIQTMGRVISKKRAELGVTMMVVSILLVFTSALMYAIESSAQPEAFSSIPATMWWSVATLTTVGYGDVYPVTTTGKLLGSLMAIFCLGLFALPAGILAGGFSEEVESQKTRVCPHCGEEVD